ncbi:stalled ribosome sensor GCN1-like [Drosophila kikkawai]|uniref:Stalled ribosome sensor GCN1-like n=1 Tax=Drosophila kikkawai TaxID=30033 RepID=A0ABM4GFN1_DROKI
MISSIFDSPSFSYAFEFIKRALLFLNIDSNTELILKCIHIIASHTSENAVTNCNPKFMPRLGMFEILLYLFKNNTKLREQTSSAIKDIARYSHEDGFCAGTYNQIISIFLDDLQYNADPVRNIVLQAIEIMVEPIKKHLQVDDSHQQQIIKRLWIAKFDSAEENRDLAIDIWDKVNLTSPKFNEVIYDILHPELCIQKSASESLMPLIAGDENAIKCAIKILFTIYNEMLTLIPPVLDKFDREIKPSTDQWKPRRGVAIAFSTLAPILSIEDINDIMNFMVSQGLGDREDVVHKEMLAAALKIVDIHGNRIIVYLLPVFEDFLDKAPKSQSYDNIRQAVVILMGSLARHLEKNDNRIDPIVKRLLTALSTPSQQVQEAVSNCLPHLMPSVKDEAPAMIKKLLHSLAKSDKYGERRGAAYGIAGIVKGLGILSLKQLDIMSKLTSYIQEKKNYKSREGALFAFEVLCTTLGRLFEPYIVHVLPHLLQCFGDSSQYVRQAAVDTAKVVMGKLSAHGVKLVLPSLCEESSDSPPILAAAPTSALTPATRASSRRQQHQPEQRPRHQQRRQKTAASGLNTGPSSGHNNSALSPSTTTTAATSPTSTSSTKRPQHRPSTSSTPATTKPARTAANSSGNGNGQRDQRKQYFAPVANKKQPQLRHQQRPRHQQLTKPTTTAIRSRQRQQQQPTAKQPPPTLMESHRSEQRKKKTTKTNRQTPNYSLCQYLNNLL